MVKNNEELKLVIIQVIIESKNKMDLLKALDYGLCFVNTNWREKDEI